MTERERQSETERERETRERERAAHLEEVVLVGQHSSESHEAAQSHGEALKR